ncbi:MAG: hypothetical protein LJD31_04500, partial [Wolbachia endosymbiont of Menacanthus eurysternus]|nr:hypothetical protein [Wolbachia endosymbiont of Menacanthus eurysternus]
MSVYQYFKRYVEYGIVPAKRTKDFTLVPESSFYKSVHYIDNVLGSVDKKYKEEEKSGSLI